MACNACHAPEIFITHTSANFEKSKTNFLKQKFFLKSTNSLFISMYREKVRIEKKLVIGHCSASQGLQSDEDIDFSIHTKQP